MHPCPQLPARPSESFTSAVSSALGPSNPWPHDAVKLLPRAHNRTGLPVTASGGPVVVKVLVSSPSPCLHAFQRCCYQSHHHHILPRTTHQHHLPPYTIAAHACSVLIAVGFTPMPVQLSAARYIPLHMRASAAAHCLSRDACAHQQHVTSSTRMHLHRIITHHRHHHHRHSSIGRRGSIFTARST